MLDLPLLQLVLEQLQRFSLMDSVIPTLLHHTLSMDTELVLR